MDEIFELSPFEREYIREKKRIEFEHAKPYMRYNPFKDFETEEELRDRVRDAILNRMSEEDRILLRDELDKIYMSLKLKYHDYE